MAWRGRLAASKTNQFQFRVAQTKFWRGLVVAAAVGVGRGRPPSTTTDAPPHLEEPPAAVPLRAAAAAASLKKCPFALPFEPKSNSEHHPQHFRGSGWPGRALP